jgi:2-isopropylmalate synthase
MANADKQIYVSDMMDKIRGELILPEKVYFFDTTLRDGEQTPGISFNLDEKIAIARALDELGIDVIEAGFPVVSDVEFESVKTIGKLGLKSEVIGLARCNQLDIDKVIQADLSAIHIFIATSEIHMKNKLKMTREQVLDSITKWVGYAKDHFKNILFSAEDACRSDLDFLIKANQTAVAAGATRINIPDTVGTVSPSAFGRIIRANYEALPKNIRINVHCHNDFGLAVANTIAGIENGACEAQTTILGLGERAGNASFEQTAMSLYAFYGLKMNIDTRKIFPTAKLVEGFCGGKIRIGRLTPLIGKNAFAHESGIHAHAVLQNARCYEPITPELLGIKRSDSFEDIVQQSIKLGKHMGGHSLKAKMKEIGINPTDEQFATILNRIKAFGSKGREVNEDDFLAIVKDVMGALPKDQQYVVLDELTVLTGSITPTATVKLTVKSNGNQKTEIASSIGVGPVDAAINAIIKCYKKMGEEFDMKLTEYAIDAVSGGSDALGHVYITVVDKYGKEYTSEATHEDIVMSSVLSLIKALNKITYSHQHTPQ